MVGMFLSFETQSYLVAIRCAAVVHSLNVFWSESFIVKSVHKMYAKPYELHSLIWIPCSSNSALKSFPGLPKLNKLKGSYTKPCIYKV